MKLILILAVSALCVVAVIAVAFLFITWYIHHQEKQSEHHTIMTYNFSDDSNPNKKQ